MGFCGERCPNICKICNKKNEIFFGDKNNENTIFYETECGHIIEYKEMDNYIKNITIPTCQKCQSLLIWEPRYQNYIREKFKEVQNIKKEYTKNDEEFKTKSKEILTRIGSQYENNKILFFDNLIEENNKNDLIIINEQIDKHSINYERKNLKLNIPIIYQLYKKIQENLESNIIKIRPNLIYYLLTLGEKFMAIEYMKYVIKNNENENGDISRDEREFMKNFFVIKDYFSNIDESFTNFFLRN